MDSLNLRWFQRLAVPDREACLAALDLVIARLFVRTSWYVLPKLVILTDYNNIHTQTSPIIHEYHCSKS